MATLQQLLDTPVSELGLSYEASVFPRLCRRVEGELARAGIRLRPHWYLSDAYGCVVRTCNIGIKWTEAIGQLPVLARRYPHLIRPADEILRTLRHEAGHAFSYVHRLYGRADFRRIFGVSGRFYATYPDGDWQPDRRALRRFDPRDHLVMYCLRHPDEDFSVGFEVWLDPASDWRHRYRRRPGVLAKLEYIDRVARRVGDRPYVSDPTDLDVPIAEIHTLAGEALAQAIRHDPGGGWYRHIPAARLRRGDARPGSSRR